MGDILKVQGICKSYDSFRLKDVSFAVPSGYIMGFIGPNGAGKTTTIKAILNMIRCQSGKIALFGMESTENASKIYDQVGVVMDTPLFADDWRAIDVEAAVSPFYTQWNSETYASLLGRFGIDRKKKVKEMSRGMKVKLMVAVALSHDARLLILDEPTSGLDPVARDELCELLGQFVSDENRAVLFSTHITSDLEKIADYITFILGGQIVFTGSKEEFMEQYVLIKGGPRDIDAQQKKRFIGLREHATGFEGMARTDDLRYLPQTLLVESITLDEIIVFMNKEAHLYE